MNIPNSPLETTPFQLGIDQFHISTNRHPIQTILGSCVGLIIADPHKGIFGVNHFLTPATGLPLSQTLLSKLECICRPTIAIIAGGSNLFGASCTGQLNIDFARNFVRLHGLGVICEEVGGQLGRTVLVEMKIDKPTIKVIFHQGWKETGAT